MANTPDNAGKKYTKHKFDKRQMAFKKFYVDPYSNTFQNARQSALLAGYSPEYADTITTQAKWFQEFQEDTEVFRANLLRKAEQHFNDALGVDFNTEEDKEKLKMKHDSAKHVSETIGKQIYSKRQEVTGADGRRLFTDSHKETASIPLSKLFKVSTN